MIQEIEFVSIPPSTDLLPGLYSDFDASILYQIVLAIKPKTIVDFAPRQGKTTSAIISALKKLNETELFLCDYYVFEKDEQFYIPIVEYLKQFKFLNLKHDTNIIGSPLLNEMKKIDFLFIDANHDYLLAKWYLENLVSKIEVGGVIHIHDMFYNITGNGWDDITMKGSPQNHPDIVDLETLKSIYGLPFFEKYYEGEPTIEQYEGDMVNKYFENNPKYLLLSSIDIAKKMQMDHTQFICSLYLEKIS